ncbi:hypothetical protein [Flavobacterium sp. LB1P71]|uniref:hypothetical protein n=1 Tax=Flavobacterium sp. LB1P71 TaxID=3401716 RepID=UPI003AAA8D4B
MKTLKAFEPEELIILHRLLAVKVAYMLGRKMEENDWGDIYCKAKKIPTQTWSNLNIDVAHHNLGVEHKMLCVRSKGDIAGICGKSFMHPSATRSIRIRTTDADANEVMIEVFEQYSQLIQDRKSYIQKKTQTTEKIDLRTGWLLWQESLHQFLYFEEETIAPSANDYTAVWEDAKVKGSRKSSKNLWIYEKASGKKKYSVTTSAGIKIQPYFDVPPPNDPNLYIFNVIGESINFGEVKVWLTQSTYREITSLYGTIDKTIISEKIIESCSHIVTSNTEIKLYEQNGEDLIISVEAYTKLYETFPEAISDEHAFLMLVNNHLP